MAIPQLITLAVGLGIAGLVLWLVHRQTQRLVPHHHSNDRYWTGNGAEQCVVCMDRKANITLLPCGHSDLCEPCTKRILIHDKRCPMCRRVVHDYE